MTTAQGYSIWIVARGPPGERLSDIIRGFSRAYKTPCFPPHVTLLARVPHAQAETVARTRELAAALDRFEIELAEPAFTTDYFRSLFIEARPEISLLAAHRRTCELFGVSPEAYLPHLSLLYGNLPDSEKQAAIAKFGRDYPSRFTAEALDVYLTEGVPEAWRLVESVSLG